MNIQRRVCLFLLKKQAAYSDCLVNFQRAPIHVEILDLTINFADIHVEYQGFEALVDIASGRMSAGDLPRKVAAIVQEWCLVHQQELQNNRVRAQHFEPLEKIQGADRD